MTPQTAFIHAGYFSVFGTHSPTFLGFNLNDGRPVSEVHRAQCIARCEEILANLTKSTSVTIDDARDIQRICDLRAFFEETPLYTRAPLAEAGPLALRALQNIRGFLDAQTLRLDDPRKDGTGADSEVATCFDYTELAQIILGESLSIVGPPAPRPEPATRTYRVQRDTALSKRAYAFIAATSEDEAQAFAMRNEARLTWEDAGFVDGDFVEFVATPEGER